MKRIDGRKPNQLRPLTFQPNYIIYPEGSVLACAGNTKVLCNVTVEEQVPRWMQQQKKSGGWITAEYSMLPRSTHTRTSRETHGVGGRTHEIKRLIGRALRAAIDLKQIGERTLTIDCDVLQADGGTRTTAISGAYVALVLALRKLTAMKKFPKALNPLPVAAVSVGMFGGTPLLDLCYLEDSKAEVDMNVVMNKRGEFIEVQGTAEGAAFPRKTLDAMLGLAEVGIKQIFAAQEKVLRG